MKKIIISGLFFMTFSINDGVSQSKAESEPATIAEQLFLFVGRLNKEIDSFFKKEKGEKMYRTVGYFRNDLGAYLKIRRVYLDSLRKWDFKTEEKTLIMMNTTLLAKIDALKKRIADISGLISDDLSEDGEALINEIEGKTVVQQIYISKLQQFLQINRRPEIKAGILEEGEGIQKNLEKTFAVTAKIRAKLKTKFNL